MGSEIENRMGFKWSSTTEACSNSCYNSNRIIKGQVGKPFEYVVGYQILRLKLWCHR